MQIFRFVNLTLLIMLLVLSTESFAQIMTTLPSNMNNAINTTTTNTDANIVSNYQSQLANDANLRTQSISASSVNGIVTLNGSVDTQAHADQAVNIARSINGVNDVHSNIKVRRTP